MDQVTTKTENELINSFMGMRSRVVGGHTVWCKENDFEKWISSPDYEKSWNSLMPVVERISEYSLAFPKETAEVCDLKVCVMRQVLYRRCVKFIEFLNKQDEFEKFPIQKF